MKAYNETLSLPFYPKLDDGQVAHILETAESALKA
jgi:hypothetical protein